MAKYRITRRAEDDLKNIGRYTKKHWGKAQRNVYLKNLDNRFNWLAENPNYGMHRTDIAEGYHSFLKASTSCSIFAFPTVSTSSAFHIKTWTYFLISTLIDYPGESGHALRRPGVEGFGPGSEFGSEKPLHFFGLQ